MSVKFGCIIFFFVAAMINTILRLLDGFLRREDLIVKKTLFLNIPSLISPINSFNNEEGGNTLETSNHSPFGHTPLLDMHQRL